MISKILSNIINEFFNQRYNICILDVKHKLTKSLVSVMKSILCQTAFPHGASNTSIIKSLHEAVDEMNSLERKVIIAVVIHESMKWWIRII